VFDSAVHFDIVWPYPRCEALKDLAACAIADLVKLLRTALVASLPHRELLTLFSRLPSVAFAIWRETLVDAAIFREAITNNSARPMPARMAHFFCELSYRARASGLIARLTYPAPISLVQLGETLGMSIATVNALCTSFAPHARWTFRMESSS
jgi:CRP-like cAMP-binding protein